MLRGSDIRRLLAERAEHPEDVDDWCVRNGVDQSTLHCVVQNFNGDPNPLAIALAAFQLGYDARKDQEPHGRAESDGGEGYAGRYRVQFVVVDSSTGRIVSEVESRRARAENLAILCNAVPPPAAPSDRH